MPPPAPPLPPLPPDPPGVGNEFAAPPFPPELPLPALPLPAELDELRSAVGGVGQHLERLIGWFDRHMGGRTTGDRLRASRRSQRRVGACQVGRWTRMTLCGAACGRGHGGASAHSTIGDLHQPLHCAALYSANQFPKGDEGGNKIPLRKGKNLHSLWDELLGKQYYMRNVEKAANELELVDWHPSGARRTSVFVGPGPLRAPRSANPDKASG